MPLHGMLALYSIAGVCHANHEVSVLHMQKVRPGR